MRLLTTLLAFACLALAGCQTFGQTIGHALPPVGTSVAASTALDEKAWYAAEATYNVAATAYLEAVEAGLVTPALKARVKPLLAQAYEALKGVRAAYHAGNAASFGAQVAEVTRLTTAVRTLLPKKA